MERNRFIRRFANEHGGIFCIICERLVTSRTFGNCPKKDQCLCIYKSNNIDITVRQSNMLFDNTEHTIISTVIGCGSNIDKCKSELYSDFTCERCNFTIAKNAYLNNEYKE